MNQALTKQRIRIRFGTRGMFRFVGHLDLQSTWERLLRRAGLPVEYSQGFNPRPRMQFAAALPVGVSSESEYLDVWLTETLSEPLSDWITRLNDVSPGGLRTLALHPVPIKDAALPTLVTSADYAISPSTDQIEVGELHQRASDLLAAETLPRTRRKKTYDLRPLILGLRPSPDGSIVMRLSAGDAGNGRIDEVIDELGYSLGDLHVTRQRLYLGDEA